MTQVVHTPITARPPERARPGAGFGGITSEPAAPPAHAGAPDFVAIHDSPEFTALRRRFRRFVFPVSALFFLWYLTYVLLAAYAREFMSHRLFGLVTVGLVLGLLQFVSTAAITYGYVRYARRQLDPRVAAIRAAAGVDKK
ncbi:DUF485 domain-containing protein [Actinophytocola oryzae]|uniref:Uncharacterized membrane protein (DUF485 family) n=1 Tax=Actinophytocola oryzae TaxID=502181 RepID=A0A4R7VAX3_9PSEU|nr:DUF485 domain-containing protein [Actinophytocola oryzae]TDV46146.1 uncharacterized membrane protein (DUF485 family) [Actinophytocola oryzae]